MKRRVLDHFFFLENNKQWLTLLKFLINFFFCLLIFLGIGFLIINHEFMSKTKNGRQSKKLFCLEPRKTSVRPWLPAVLQVVWPSHVTRPYFFTGEGRLNIFQSCSGLRNSPRACFKHVLYMVQYTVCYVQLFNDFINDICIFFKMATYQGE